jgi:gamma-glutamyltranspeptidase/glutathione hydrolase
VGVDRRLAPDALAALEARFAVEEVEAVVWPKLFACPSAILRARPGGEAVGMTDPLQPVAGVAVA